jgi:hypothetical protein
MAKNLYETKDGVLVSILNAKDANKTLVISSAGFITTVKKADLQEASLELVSGGLYNENFLQVSLGGLAAKPYYLNAKEKVYPGLNRTAAVCPVDVTTVKFLRYAVGVPDEAHMNQPLPKDHTNDGKEKRFPQLVPGASTLGGNTPSSSATGGDLIPLDSGEEGTVTKLILTWNTPMELSLDQINEYFETSELLPLPDTIKMVLSNGSNITSNRSKSQATGSDETSMTKQAYYGLTPVATRVCPKCGATAILDTDRKTGLATNKCIVCKWSTVYEGSINDGTHGLAGQTKNETLEK